MGNLMTLICSQMIQLVFEHGHSNYSGFAFSALSVILNRVGSNNVSKRVGKLAMFLMEKMKTKEMIVRVNMAIHMHVSPFYISVHKIFMPLLSAYEIGLEIGSHESCRYIANGHATYAFLSGKCLSLLIDDLQDIDSALPLKTKYFLAIYQ